MTGGSIQSNLRLKVTDSKRAIYR